MTDEGVVVGAAMTDPKERRRDDKEQEETESERDSGNHVTDPG